MKNIINRRLIARIFVFLILFSIIPILYVFAIGIGIDYSDGIPEERPCIQIKGIDMEALLKTTASNHLLDDFPYDAYLASGRYCSLSAIKSDLEALDSLNPTETRLNQDILAITLTEKLEEEIAESFLQFNPDSMIQLLQWANQFNIYKELDSTHGDLFEMIYFHWLNFISNKLGGYYQEDSSIKYDYKFKYLVSTCKSKQFSPPIGNTNLEKVVNYMIDKQYSYLFFRFWNNTGLLFKIGLLMLFTLGFYSAYRTIDLHIKALKK